MEKVRVLHICRDDKFLKGTMSGFSKMADSTTSEYVILNKSNKKLKYIDETELTVFTNCRSFKAKLKEGSYDVVYFHSLPPENYWMINNIPTDKIIIWWSWGYDIYNGGMWGWTSFINVKSIKKQTKKLQSQSRSSIRIFMLLLCKFCYEIYGRLTRRSVLKRIDFFRPVLPVEYEMMKQNKGFRAREYYPLNYEPSFHVKRNSPPKKGSIVLGNSASAFNNHADVWDCIKDMIPRNRKIFVPLSYGTMRYAKKVKEYIKWDNLCFVDDFLPKEKYFDLIDECSYAVYGSVRQHAMGNIFHALSEGMKVFLYKDSVVYQSLKNMGFVVFAIEEINQESFVTTISIEELSQNEKAFDRLRNHCTEVKIEAMKCIKERVIN